MVQVFIEEYDSGLNLSWHGEHLLGQRQGHSGAGDLQRRRPVRQLVVESFGLVRLPVSHRRSGPGGNFPGLTVAEQKGLDQTGLAVVLDCLDQGGVVVPAQIQLDFYNGFHKASLHK